MTVGELLDRWLDLKAMTVEANTANGYRWIVEHYVRPVFGDRKVVSIRTLEFDHWYQQLRTGGGAAGRPLSGRTVRLCHTVMGQSLEQARRWGLIARNPAVDATPPAARRTEIKPPTIQQVHDLLAAAFEFDPDFGVYLWLLAVTGCRRGEGCALRWTDVHWERGEIAISRSIAMVDQERIEKDTKTHQARRVAIDEATRELLRDFHLRARERALAVGVALADGCVPVLRGGRRIGALAAGCLYELVRPPPGRARPDHVRLHDVRHFVATVLGDAGTNIATISARLGHRDKATTLNIYSHSFPAADAEAGALMGTILGAVPVSRRRVTSGSAS